MGGCSLIGKMLFSKNSVVSSSLAILAGIVYEILKIYGRLFNKVIAVVLNRNVVSGNI